MDKEPTLADQLRHQATTKQDAFNNPYWADESRRLMAWAANALDAADAAIKENIKLGVGE